MSSGTLPFDGELTSCQNANITSKMTIISVCKIFHKSALDLDGTFQLFLFRQLLKACLLGEKSKVVLLKSLQIIIIVIFEVAVGSRCNS